MCIRVLCVCVFAWFFFFSFSLVQFIFSWHTANNYLLIKVQEPHCCHIQCQSVAILRLVYKYRFVDVLVARSFSLSFSDTIICECLSIENMCGINFCVFFFFFGSLWNSWAAKQLNVRINSLNYELQSYYIHGHGLRCFFLSLSPSVLFSDFSSRLLARSLVIAHSVGFVYFYELKNHITHSSVANL